MQTDSSSENFDSSSENFEKVALVTGPASGIGAAIARAFSEQSALVKIADVSAVHDLEDLPLDDWQRTFDINVTGVFLACKENLRLLKKSPGSSSEPQCLKRHWPMLQTPKHSWQYSIRNTPWGI